MYHFRAIFHDWPDSACHEILKRTVAAMTKGYSRVLITDYAIPDMQCPLLPALMDLNMIVLLTGIERTESQWRTLLGSVGLEIVRFWTPDVEAESLIEAMLK